MIDINISFAPLFPIVGLGALAVVAVLLAAFMFWKRQRGALVRSLAFATLFAALLNPTITQIERDPLPGIVTVIVDQSESAGLSERRDISKAIRDGLEARFAAHNGYEVRVVNAGDSDPTTGDDGTRLFAALNRALADVPPEQIAGAILVTDGQIHDVPEAANALGFDAPLHTFLTGNPDERDRRILLNQTPRFGIVGQEQQVTFRISDEGIRTLQRVRVIVRYDGETIATRNATTGETVTFTLPVEHAGANVFEFEVEPLEGELTPANNNAVVALEGIRENLRVLLVSGEPHPGERTWRNLLKSDAAVDLVHFTILRPPEKQDGTPINQLSLIAFPTRELFSVKIDEFDLIIFDRYQRRGVLPIIYFDNIARYVKDGGALMVAAGPEYAAPVSIYRTPIAPVLPALPTGEIISVPFKPQVTDPGNRHPVTQNLPGANSGDAGAPVWGRWLRAIEATPDRGRVIMSGPNETPLLVLSHEDTGRVAMLLSDHAWLWARGFEGGGPQVALLRRLSHWLMKEPELEEERLVARHIGPNLVIERRSMSETVETVTVTAPDGTTSRIDLEESEPGSWQGKIAADNLGVYRVRDSDLSALAHVGPLNPRELTNVTATDALVGNLVAQTGGAVEWVARPSSFSAPRIVPLRDTRNWSGEGWIGVKRVTASVVRDTQSLSLFSGLLGLALLLGVFAMTWYREGR